MFHENGLADVKLVRLTDAYDKAFVFCDYYDEIVLGFVNSQVDWERFHFTAFLVQSSSCLCSLIPRRGVCLNR